MHHRDNLRVQGRKPSRIVLSCCFLSAGPAPIPSQSQPRTGVTCLNAKSRHCRSGYLCARTRARKTLLVFGRRDSRMISRHVRRTVYRQHMPHRKSFAGRKIRPAIRKQGIHRGGTNNHRNHDNICTDTRSLMTE